MAWISGDRDRRVRILYKKHLCLPSSKATHPAFLKGAVCRALYSPLPVCSYFRHQAFSLLLDEFRHANLKPWHVMLAEKHLRLEARHSNPHPVTVREWL